MTLTERQMDDFVHKVDTFAKSLRVYDRRTQKDITDEMTPDQRASAYYGSIFNDPDVAHLSFKRVTGDDLSRGPDGGARQGQDER